MLPLELVLLVLDLELSEIDPDLIYNPNLTIAEGGIYPWSKMWDSMNSWNRMVMETVCKKYEVDIKTQ